MTGEVRREKVLVCSMITISENAALKKNSISIEMILCRDCDQQKCQDIISYENPFCDLKHEHDQCECDSIATGNILCYASHNRIIFSHTFLL